MMNIICKLVAWFNAGYAALTLEDLVFIDAIKSSIL